MSWLRTFGVGSVALFALGACGDDGDGAGGAGGAGGSTGTTTSSSSTGGGPACTPGEEVACYTGPAGTLGIGTCASGTTTCGADGTPGPCNGQVLPTDDPCRSPQDEDCDGTPAVCTGAHLWSRRFGNSSQQNPNGVAVDPDGNIVLFGSSSGVMDFGGPPISGLGGFLAKLDGDGNHLWSKTFASASIPPTGRAMTVDRYGNVFLVGDMTSPTDFGGGTLTPSGSADVFLVKLDSDGNHLWSKRFGDASLQLGWSVVADIGGNVIVVGEHAGTIDFGGAPLTAPTQINGFVAKLDPDGNHVWSRTIGNAGPMNLRDITTDSSNNVILTGYFFGSLDLGAGPMVSAGQADAFVVKYDALGNLVWSKRFGGTGGESSIGLATDGQGDIAFVGQHTAPADFGGGTLPSEGGGDVYVVKLDPAGNHLWSKSFGDAAKQAPLDIASDPAGCFMINGIYQGTVDFGGNPLVSAGDDDVFLVKLGIDGEHLWSHGFGDAERQVGHGVSSDADGNVVLTGDLRLSIDFGGGPLTSAGDYDVFLAKYAE